jgi:UDP-glucose 4-epimerase
VRCLVTGASGHLGSYLTRLLVRRGHQVAVLVRPQSDLWRIGDVQHQTRLVRGDLAAIDRARAEVAAFQPETVFHLGWLGVWDAGAAPAAQIEANVVGSLRLLQIALAAGCKCWVGVGSQAEYGLEPGPWHEDLPARPVTAYGVAKLCVGLLTRTTCEAAGIRAIWLRLLATYGPGDVETRLIPTVIAGLLRGQTSELTAGDQSWDFVHVEDAAAAVYTAAVESRAHGLFNLASGESHPVREIVERLRDLIDPTLPLTFGALPYPIGQPMRLEADISRFQAATGWRPAVPLDAGLRATVEWYRARLGPEGAPVPLSGAGGNPE